MATHDYDIANQSGANFRTDLNNCLDAIVSNNSNSSDPSTTFAYMWWVDTSNNVLKLRNSANNAWITLPMSITASNTITPTLNMGTGAEEDVKIVFDGNAKDFYIALDDSADKLIIGEGSTVGTNPILTITDDSIVIGDGAAVDTKIVFDGNAQDYYIGLDDSSDDLIIGKGSTVATTPAISIDENLKSVFGGTVDVNGNELILDADADTSITADTDDQIDFKVGGTDRLSLESDGKLKVTEIAHITSGTLEIGNGDEKQLFDATEQSIEFQTADTERARFDNSGNFLIGTTATTTGLDGGSEIVTDTGNANGLYINANRSGGNQNALALRIANYSASNYIDFRFGTGFGSRIGTISSPNGTTISYNTSSDYRLKENIVPMEKGLERINKLKPVKFDWKSNGTTSEGFIAHEVQEAGWNEGVEGKKDDAKMQMVDYGKLTPLLVKAIQEQQEQIEELKKEIETLKN